MANRLLPFLIENRGVRGFAVEITEGIPDLLGWRAYPPDVLRLLGHALAATPLLAADLRHDARFNLQFQGKVGGSTEAPLKLLVTQIDQSLQMRGMAKFAAEAEGDFQALMGGGTLACLIEPRNGGERYQALVEIAGITLSEALEIYYGQSEQLPTRVRLGAAPDRFVGLLLQRLPEGSDDDDWVHVHHLVQTLHEPELLATDAETLLRRLFNEDTVRVFDARPLTLQCQCSHAQISAMLLGLGEEELKPLLIERGRVDVTCEFCGKDYGYREVEVRELFAAAQAESASHRLQ